MAFSRNGNRNREDLRSSSESNRKITMTRTKRKMMKRKMMMVKTRAKRKTGRTKKMRMKTRLKKRKILETRIPKNGRHLTKEKRMTMRMMTLKKRTMTMTTLKG